MSREKNFSNDPYKLTPLNELDSLIENRSVFNMGSCEMNLFETFQRSEKVKMRFPDLVYTAMLRGKKVMHLFGDQHHFDYLPGESVIMPSNEKMIIDFPEASIETPAQCIALAIDEDLVRGTMDRLNEKFAKVNENDSWKIQSDQFHIHNTQEISFTLDRLMRLAHESNPLKEVFVNLAVEELLLRLMQTQARGLLFKNYQALSTNHRFAAVIAYIQDHLHENITVEKLADVACLSKPHFFRSFKRELGLSPVDYIIRVRMAYAQKLLQDGQSTVSEVCYRLGFQSVNYFCTLFKKYIGMSPGKFQKSGANPITITDRGIPGLNLND